SRLGSRRRGRRCASRPRETRPARSSTFRCLEIAGWLIANGSASSVTDALPDARRARIARRVGSARAAKMVSRRCVACITYWLYTGERAYRQAPRLSGDPRPPRVLHRAAQRSRHVDEVLDEARSVRAPDERDPAGDGGLVNGTVEDRGRGWRVWGGGRLGQVLPVFPCGLV